MYPIVMVVLLGLQASDSGEEDVKELYEEYDGGFSMDGDGIAQKGAHSPPREEAGEFKDESDSKRRKRSSSANRASKGLQEQSIGVITRSGAIVRANGAGKADHSRLDGYLLRKRRGNDPIVARQAWNSCQDGELELGVRTRAMAKKSVQWLSMLPTELWCEVMSHLPYRDIGRTICVCKEFTEVDSYIWKSACMKMWPTNTAMVAQVPDSYFGNPQTRWRKCYEMLSLRSAEKRLVTGWGTTFTHLQKHVTPYFRAVLVEWMIEVAQDWRLESTVIFQAVRYLDHYLRNVAVDDLSKFQLIGVSCLRLSIMSLRQQIKVSKEQLDCLMDPSRFAAVCDGAATKGEVVKVTEYIESIIPSDLIGAPNSKMYLRCLWYTISKNGIAGCTSEDMHIYVLAAFLLEMGLLNTAFSCFSHSAIAAAAMSLALEFHGKNPWPTELLSFSSYSITCISPQRKLLAWGQALSSCIDIRNMWSNFYRNHLYHDKKNLWDRSLSIMTRRGGDLIDLAWSGCPEVLDAWSRIKQDGIDPDQYDTTMSSILNMHASTNRGT